ncbi:MAG: calcium/sodium antiporter [Planctomycetota bacterium]
MNMVTACLALIAGLAVLWKAAELLVDGAVGLAARLGVSPLVIGLTVVAMGTSSPEVAAGIVAAVRGLGNVTIGNIYGSNIANLALVGGIAALIRPIQIKGRLFQREIPAMLVSALLLWPFVHNLYLSRLEGAALLSIFAVLILLTVYMARKEGAGEVEGVTQNTSNQVRDTGRSAFYVVIGLVGLGFGARITVDGAVFIGRGVGLSEAVIGLTIIAVGTSLPELVTCVVAAVKGQNDISIGNLVGSNVFNTLMVSGAAGTVRPFYMSSRLAGVDYWVMIIVTAGFVFMGLMWRRIGRVSAAILLCGYVGYIVYLLALSG